MATPDYVLAYRKHKNLKIAAEELGMKWQTLYVKLCKHGEPVTGDKERYGTEKDKFAAKAERRFLELVPDAEDMNRKVFQSKYDFDVHGLRVDVKASKKKRGCAQYESLRWSFSIKKQRLVADFIVCLCYDGDEHIKTLLLPNDICKNHGTISLGCRGGKWGDYEIESGELSSFFAEYAKVRAA